VRPLREAVTQVRVTPAANEDAFNGTIGIYEKVSSYGRQQYHLHIARLASVR